MDILDESLDYDNRCEVLEDCACCLSGTTEKKVKKNFPFLFLLPIVCAVLDISVIIFKIPWE